MNNDFSYFVKIIQKYNLWEPETKGFFIILCNIQNDIFKTLD